MLLQIPVQCKKRVRVFAWFICATSVSFHSRNYEGNHGYKLSVQRFLSSFGWTNVSYDWPMVFGSRQPLTNRKKRLSTQPIPEIIAPKACTHPPYSFWGRKYGGGEREEPSLESFAVVILEKE